MSKIAEELAMDAYPGQMFTTCARGNRFAAGPLFRGAFIRGYEQAEKDLGWHSVDESLPEPGEAVIVLADHFRLNGFCRIGFGYIVDHNSSATNGWNIPGVKFWAPMPKIPEE